MSHPLWRCRCCGERLYGHVDGGYRCANCGRRYEDDELEDDGF